LGYPLVLEKYPDGKLKEISTPLDLLSFENGYNTGVRKSVWKLPFTDFIPIYITGSHWRRARPIFGKSVSSITGKPFAIYDAMDILCKLMNTMIVQVMKESTFASILALQGYCHFHRLLMQLVFENKILQDHINRQIDEFIKYPNMRVKSNLPSLGDWLPLLSVSSKYKFTDNLRMLYLQEHFDRNARWILQEHRDLQRGLSSTGADLMRNTLSFKATQVSQRLLLFHIYFLNKIARPPGISLKSQMQRYDAFYGCVSSHQIESFQKEVKRIQGINSFPHFFNYMNLAMSEDKISDILRKAIVNSEKKRYHKPQY